MTATIKGIDENRHVTVKYCEDEECAKCEGGCSTGFKQKETKLTELNAQDLSLKAGDAVELFVSPRKAIKAGFLILILPLLLFVAFYFAGESLLGIASELLQVLFALCGIALGLLLNVFLKKSSTGKELPEIFRKIS